MAVTFFIFIAACFAAALFMTLEIALDPDGEGQTWVIWPAVKRLFKRRRRFSNRRSM